MQHCSDAEVSDISFPPATSHDEVIQGDKDDGNFGAKNLSVADFVSSQERDLYDAYD